jgi:hypothetical protein
LATAIPVSDRKTSGGFIAVTETNSTGATIGAGLAGVMPRSGWASYTRIPALRSLAGYDVVAVANSNMDSSRAAAEALGAARHVVLPYQAPLELASGGADFAAGLISARSPASAPRSAS